MDAWSWERLVITLLIFAFFLGVLSVLAGVGGALIFVPLMTLWAPFLHVDFIRATGLMMALVGALFAGPLLIRQRLVNFRLAILIGMLSSTGAIFGAKIGLRLSVPLLQQLLVMVMLVVVCMYLVRISRGAKAARQLKTEENVSRWQGWLRLEAQLYDFPNQRWLSWQPRFLWFSLVMVVGGGFLSGMLGLGGGWIYVPLLNLVMGLPLRFAVATSGFIIAIVNTAAVPIYLKHGALQPLLSIPCVLGMVLGARLGSRLLRVADHYWLQWLVLLVLCFSGFRILLRSFGW